MQQAEQAADAPMSMGKMEAPCSPLRTALHSIEKGTKEQIEEAQDEERHYTSMHQRAQETVEHGQERDNCGSEVLT